MPPLPAGNCEPFEASIRASLKKGANSGSSYLDDQLMTAANRVLLTTIDFHSPEKEYSSSRITSLQSKYICLIMNSEDSSKIALKSPASFPVRKESPDANIKDEPTSGGSSSSRKKRKQSSSESSSSDGDELERVEETKETLEEEKAKSRGVFSVMSRGGFVVPVKQWDADIKDGLKKQLSDPPLKNGELSNSAMLGNWNNGTASVVEILKKGGRGFGDGVKSWDGCQSMVNRDMEQEMHFNYSRHYSDAYNQGYDQGKTKKVKHPRRYNSNPNLGENPFQRMQDLKEAGKYFTPKSWQQFKPHSPCQ